jgi:hypothetical protein
MASYRYSYIYIVVGRVRAAAQHEPKQQANAGRNHAV